MGESMRPPFWAINLSLLLLLIGAILFSVYANIKTPAFKQVKKSTESSDVNENANLDTKIIYQNDLFETTPSVQEVSVPKETVVKLPIPPRKINPQMPLIAEFKFMEPLPITLTGIIYYNDYSKDRAIIFDNRSKNEKIYKTEDEFEDAQIINILNDKVILLRSNGQQEIVYLTQEYKETKLAAKDWKKIVEPISENSYLINKSEFIKEMPTLSDLIFKFNIKSAVENKKPIGLKIGNIDSGSLALALGIRPGDVILSINDMPIDSTASRMDAYNNIVNNSRIEKVNINLIRNNKKLNLVYEVKDYLDKGPKSGYKDNEAEIYPGELNHDFANKEPQQYDKILQNAKYKDKDNILNLRKNR